MKVIRLTSFVLAAALPLAGAMFAQSPSESQSPAKSSAQSPDQAQTKTFSGKISKDSNGNYILQDSSSSGAYTLDDQKAAKKYEGKNVVVTGTLDAGNNTIHVAKIDGVA